MQRFSVGDFAESAMGAGGSGGSPGAAGEGLSAVGGSDIEQAAFGLFGFGMLAEHGEKLFGAAALIALEMADDDEFAGRRAAGEPEIGEGVAVLRHAVDLGENGDAGAHRHEGLQGGD